MYFDYEVLINRDFLRVLEDIVDRAKRRIYIATYIATKSKHLESLYYAIAAAQRRGVDVQILLNGASSEAMKFNRKSIDFMERIGIKRVRLTTKFMHIKLYIVDDYFIVGSHNLSASTYEGRYEVSIMIRSRKMADKLAEVYRRLVSKESTSALIYRDVIDDTYYEVSLNHRILRDIYEKTRFSFERIRVLMYIATLSKGTIPYYELLSAKYLLEGVDVKVLLNGVSRVSRRYNVEVYEYLKSLGLEKVVLLSREFVHAKMFILDDFVVVGSHNLTSASIAGRLELSLAIKSRNLADALCMVFESIWRRQQELARKGIEAKPSRRSEERGR